MKTDSNILQGTELCQTVFLLQTNVLRGCRIYSVYGEEIFCVHQSKPACVFAAGV